MTQIDGHAARRRFTWSARSQGNRIFFSLLAGWLIWMLTGGPTAVVFIGSAVIAYAALTVFFLVRNAYAGSERQL
jgi:hypothetical protein